MTIFGVKIEIFEVGRQKSKLLKQVEILMI